MFNQNKIIRALPIDQEAMRLEALRQTRILDTSPESAFDDLTRLAAQICEMPIALIVFVDDQRQWFKSKVGLRISELPRNASLSATCIAQRDLLIVPDTLADDRFTASPDVCAFPYLRFYAGTPLMTPEGHALGVLCVGDRTPRSLNAAQIEALQALGRQVVSQLELRRKSLEPGVLIPAYRCMEQRLREREIRLSGLFESNVIGIFFADVNGEIIEANEAFLQMVGYTPEDLQAGLLNWQHITPSEYRDLDHQKSQELINQGVSKPFEKEYIRKDGNRVPVLVGLASLESQASGSVSPGERFAFVLDITQRKQADEAQQQQAQRDRLVAEIAQHIRQSLQLEEILQTTVSEVQRFLQTDRVFIYRFEPDWSGVIVVESVAENWTSLLGEKIKDSFFSKGLGRQLYTQGRIQAIADVYAADLSECHVDLLQKLQVKANLVVPIIQEDKLWGLLVANHCASARQWQDWEIGLLKQLATQVAIAIQQSELYQQVQTELNERKQIEAELRKAHQQLNFHVENSPLAVIEWDCERRVQRWSKQAEQIFGWTAAETIGKSWQGWQFVFEADHEAVRQATTCLLDGSTPRSVSHNRNYTKDGRIVYCEWYNSVLLNEMGQPVSILSLVQDISDRQRAEQQLYEQAALLNVSTDAIMVRTLDHKILFWSRGASALYGWQTEEVLGQNINQFLFKSALSELQEIHTTVINQGEWQGELHKNTKSGAEVIVESRWSLVRDADGQPKSILTVDTDITEKKQLESQFLRTQRMESLGTLASGIAHDLNNILAPILSAAQLLQIKFPKADAHIQQLLQLQETNAKRGAALVKQVLSFARGVEGKRTVLQMRHLIAEIQQIATETFPKSIEASTEVSPDLWLVRGDATQLHQVLVNLCVNARDAMPYGGKLKITADNVLINENYARLYLDAKVGHYIAITVADTGTGIPPEILDRIFEPFFTTKDLGQGTGLGLSTALGIIKSHGGFVSVTSEINRGTQFKVYLPAAQESESLSVEGTELPRGHGEVILVVDDETSVRETVTASLESYGYRVLTASDGIEAITLYAQQREAINLAVVDMVMPAIDGSITIRTLQKMNPKLKIIAASGLFSSDRVAAAIGAGAKAFLSKPYTVGELLQTLNEVLHGE